MCHATCPIYIPQPFKEHFKCKEKKNVPIHTYRCVSRKGIAECDGKTFTVNHN